MIIMEISGLPTPWTAARISPGRHAFNPKYKEKQYAMWQLRPQWNQGAPYGGPVILDFTFHMPIPSGTSKIRRTAMLNGKLHHLKRPDATNLQKFAEDCLKAVVFEDDSQVVDIRSRKIYAEMPKTVIRINLIRSDYATD